MKQLDYEDKEPYRKIAAVRSSATLFTDGAEQAYAQRDGTSTAGAGAFFHREAELLGGVESNLDEARYERLRAWAAERRPARDRRKAYVALRDTVCAARQFGASQTGAAATPASKGRRLAIPRSWHPAAGS